MLLGSFVTAKVETIVGWTDSNILIKWYLGVLTTFVGL